MGRRRHITTRASRRVYLGDFDAIINLAQALHDAGHVGPTTLAATNQDIALRGRIGMKRTVRRGMRLGLSLGAEGSDGFCSFDGGTLELSGVFGGRPSFASRSADSRHQQSVLRHQRLDPSQKRGDQSVLVSQIRRRSHL